MPIQRGLWKEIKIGLLTQNERTAVKSLVARASNAAKVDEHGSWDFGTAFNRRGRGEALNWDLYGMGRDVHAGQLLIVIQVRKAFVGTRWTNVRKNYFLIGENEDGTVFAHPVSANVVHSAINREQDVVRSVQNWIFGGEYDAMLRQGDIALLKMWETPRAAKVADTSRMLLASHWLTAREMRENSNLYVKDPIITHPTHPTVNGRGWYRVIIGQRADFWKFAAPTKD